MISSLRGTLRWTLSLGAKFARVVPFSTVLIIGLTLVSQIAMLVASLLPLKVVILLGSERIPRYFPAFLADYGHDVLIALLSGVTVGFFLLHLLAERLITWRTGAATRRLLAMSQKMPLFERQDDVARESYQRFSRALASAVFIVLSLLGLGFFYPVMMGVQLGYMLFVFGLLGLLQHVSPSFHERLETRPAPILAFFAGIGFFVAFAYLVVDFILFEPPGVIVAIVSLLLSRQVMNRAAGVAGDFYSLQKQRFKLDALFFHGKVLMPQLPEAKGIWALLQPQARRAWMRPILSGAGVAETTEVVANWQQLGQVNVGALQVRAGEEQYLLKLYESNRASWAMHELTLLAEKVSGLPGLKLVGAKEIGDHHCLIYALPRGENPKPTDVKKAVRQLRTDLFAVVPPASLSAHYQRSKPILWQRLDRPLLEPLQVAIDSQQQQQVLDSFLDQLPELQGILRSLPLAVLNPDIGPDALWLTADERCLSLHWGRWSLEPVGAGWPEAPRDLELLPQAVSEAALHRKELTDVSVAHVELATLTFALERECGRQRFVTALELVGRILVLMEQDRNGSDAQLAAELVAKEA